ncbi:MAG: Acetyltransferase domain [Chloroflexota bacterium]|nr:Acetyltransferase domain [Chloroflexota bacterium]
MTQVQHLRQAAQEPTDSADPANDHWLSARTHLECYEVNVSSDEELSMARHRLPAGSYLTARSSIPLREHVLPLVDRMALLRRIGAPPVDPSPGSTVTLRQRHAAELGELLADHFAHRWSREPAFESGLVRQAYRDWGVGLPQRSLLIRGAMDGNRIIAVAAVRLLDQEIGLVDPIVTHFDFRSKGLATTVLRGALALLPSNISSVEAAVATDNEASLRVFDKLGFEPYAQRYLYAGLL